MERYYDKIFSNNIYYVGLKKGFIKMLTFKEVKTRSRRISQSVKDKVWNRDGGCCVLCGSNENIEFDHIVPFSKGGSNTYRNIQILCESCNRKKSDNIGISEDYFDSDYNLDDDEWLDTV